MPTVECHGAGLYYEEYGEGQPIVFLHGTGAGLRYFEPQLTNLSNEYRTIAFDFRGHGRSEKTDMGHTLPQYARDVHAFLEAQCLDGVVLVGWSLGALVAWEYVEQFGTERLRALVNVDMEAAPGDEDEATAFDPDRLRNIHVGIQTGHLEYIRQATDVMLKDPPSAKLRAMMFDEMSRSPPLVKSSIFVDSAMRDYREILPTIDVQMLVCAGADEKWRTVAGVERTAELVPDAEFELFEESGHCLTVEEPERFNRVVSEFVESL